jgi:hypothetical protein
MDNDTNNFIDEFFKDLESEQLKKNIKHFIVKPILSMIYNELFPYICFFTSILVLCIFLLLFVIFILAFSN